MEPVLPWYKSAIIRQQIAAFLIAGLGLFKITTDIDIDATLTAVFAGIAAIIPVWTIVTRLFKPNPNMTMTAAAKEAALKKAGEMPAEPLASAPSTAHPHQGGFFRPAMVMWLALFAGGISIVVLPGCAHTKDAYTAARATDNSVADTAYVVAEHYAAVVREAAQLAEAPTTPESVKDAMKAADKVLKPLILGDANTGQPGLRTLSERYTAVRTAASQSELQTAINEAVLELSKLINAVKAARGTP